MPDTGKWSYGKPAEQAEDETKVERLAEALRRRFGAAYIGGAYWLKDAREILEEIE